ncbi:MAG TPA: cache domain-containing protein [Chryseosolibacter sp.]
MKLKQQITLFALLGLLVPAVLISSFSIYKIKSRAEADIAEYEQTEYNKLKLYLKHITDVAYGLIDTRYDEAQQLASKDTSVHVDVLMEQALADLSKIRFDRGEGYYWVTDNKLPYPKMMMHAEKPKLKGQVLDDPSFNVEKKNRRNIYQVRAELCNTNGDAFVDYIMKKPGSEEVVNKLSYSRLHPESGWIVSAGFYTDQITAAVVAKQEALSKQINDVVMTIVVITVLVLIIGVGASFYFSGKLSKAILLIRDKLKALGMGHQVEELKVTRKDEVGEMTQSLNMVVTGLRSYTAFAKDIGQGNLTREFTPLSAEDMLGNELLQMRSNLKAASDEKNIRDWFNEGLAKLADVLRKNNNDTQTLADEILKALITYLKVNQGGLFLHHPANGREAGYLELISMYAYDRKRYTSKRIDLGEGLIGQCVLERATHYLKVIPQNYITITSGLGGAQPGSVLIVPLIHNSIVYGAIEMASFNEMLPHEIEFVEKVAESIASTIATVQVNENTRKLLEHSQQMSEELKAQEEELRQNQEELQATQEQMQRRQLELEQENRELREAVSQAGNENVKTAA